MINTNKPVKLVGRGFWLYKQGSPLFEPRKVRIIQVTVDYGTGTDNKKVTLLKYSCGHYAYPKDLYRTHKEALAVWKQDVLESGIEQIESELYIEEGRRQRHLQKAVECRNRVRRLKHRKEQWEKMLQRSSDSSESMNSNC